MKADLKQFSQTLLFKGIQFVVAIIILIFAHLVGKFVSNTIFNLGKIDPSQLIKSKNGPTNVEQEEQASKVNLIFATLGKISYYVIMVITFFIVLRILGIESTSLIALIGAAGFAIGLAIQGTLSDISSGVVIALLQTYSIGEIIQVNELEGKVVDFNILNTIIEDVDTGVAVTIPNRVIQESIIINHTRNPKRYLVYDFVVSNKETNIDNLVNAVKASLFNVDEVLKDPEPEVYVKDVNQYGTTITVKAAIRSKDYEILDDGLRTKIRQVFVDNKAQFKI